MEQLQLSQLRLEAAKEEIRRCEDLNALYGLTLSERDIQELVQLRAQALQDSARVELGEGILPALIRAFCSSPYVDSHNYATTLGQLQEAFYYFKNESCDRFSDEELVDFMVSVFNSPWAAGSAELLTDISLEQLCRWAREDSRSRYADEEDFF